MTNDDAPLSLDITNGQEPPAPAGVRKGVTPTLARTAGKARWEKRAWSSQRQESHQLKTRGTGPCPFLTTHQQERAAAPAGDAAQGL